MPYATTLNPANMAMGLKTLRKLRFHIRALIIMLLLPVCVSAEPSSFTKSLMNEPATMLDIGMVRLRALTTRAQNLKLGMYWQENDEMGRFNAYINSNYDPVDDKVYISFSVMQSGLSESQMASGCRIVMANTRTWVIKSLHSLFHHVGEGNLSNPTHEELQELQEMQELIEFKCTFSSKKSSGEILFRASWPLADEEMKIDPLELTN